MKKILIVLLAFVAISSMTAYAAPEGEFGSEGGGQQYGGGKDKMKHQMMMGMMNRPTVTATSDGGIVIMEGPRLIKYDKDLKLVNEVELKRPKKGQRPGSEGQQEQGASEDGAEPPAEPAG